jgi:hypothetical protein
MNRITYFLFAIPAVSIVVIALYQIIDEMTKKHFVLERRAGTPDDQTAAGAPKRRYSDAVSTGTVRNPETASSDPAAGSVGATAHKA